MVMQYINIFHGKTLQNLPKSRFLVLKYAIWQPCHPLPRNPLSNDPERQSCREVTTHSKTFIARRKRNTGCQHEYFVSENLSESYLCITLKTTLKHAVVFFVRKFMITLKPTLKHADKVGDNDCCLNDLLYVRVCIADPS
jgi:hypothetical protein